MVLLSADALESGKVVMKGMKLVVLMEFELDLDVVEGLAGLLESIGVA